MTLHELQDEAVELVRQRFGYTPNCLRMEEIRVIVEVAVEQLVRKGHIEVTEASSSMAAVVRQETPE